MLADNWFNQFGGNVESAAYDYANGTGGMPTGGYVPPGGGLPGTTQNPNTGFGGGYDISDWTKLPHWITNGVAPPEGWTPPPYDPTRPMTAAGGGTGTASAPTGGGATAFGQAWLASGGRTVQDLQNFVAQHPEYGAQLVGSKRDKVTIGNQTFDAVIGAGAGGLGGSWNDVTAGGGGSPSQGGTLGSLSFGSLAQGPQLSVDQLRQTPGYQFAFDQGQQAIQRSAASKGTLLTGGTMKALAGYGTGLADQTYGQAFDRARNVQNDVFNRYYSLGNWGMANPGA